MRKCTNCLHPEDHHVNRKSKRDTSCTVHGCFCKIFDPMIVAPREDPDDHRMSPEGRREDIVKDRSDFYGDVRLSHQAIGLAFEAVLSNRYHWLAETLRDKSLGGEFIPDELAALMLAVFKTIRAARPAYREDSYDDNINFLKFSQDMRVEDEEDKLGTIK